MRDTGKSAYELKTGQRPKMNMFYPWACKMIVKSPSHLVANGVSPTGEMAAFLGISRTSPGWKYVITEGPRNCLLYTSPSPRDKRQSRMPSSA